uniref:CCHC-type domain-containing protein n=1 Tax=Cajanus cajan TaxID=3821 RepID=A0A151QRI2_CAJCA|nr:hypothetical protein KK1_046284 [Cajanus cajan]
MLVGEAEYWWDGTRRLLEGGGIIITWEVFRAKIFEKYFPNDVKRAKEIEFIQLKQGNMIVGEYASKFEELGKYSALFYHTDERMKCIKFEDGLRPELRKAVGILEISDFPTLIHKCRFLEGFDHNKDNRPKSFGPHFNKKRNNEGKPYDRSQWKLQSSQFAGNSSRPMNNQAKCLKYGQGDYTKDCHLKGPVCFKCGKPSHVFYECGKPKAYANTSGTNTRPPTTGKVYTMTGTEASQNNDLIQGKCFIKGKTLNVYDSGATHSFISNDCVQHLQLPVSSLENNLIVLTPTNKSVIANKVCLDCLIFIGDRKFLVNLICLPLSQLDVILGMDWLSSNHVFLNCAEKSVMFSDSKDLSISLSKSISKFSWGKVQGYLILSSMEANEEVDLKNIAVVQNFPEVFPNDIPGLPPDREVEFSIDLMPGTGPISMAPYRISPSELAELKKQLEELLEK